ncbi:MAG: FtsX-like permease family protein, partial [Candidatus Odinarchaeota archaeon]
ALITAITAVTLFVYARTVQNNRETALGRTLGLKRHQLFMLVFTEPLIVFLLSAIPGTILGILILAGTVRLYSSSALIIPPVIIDYNLPAMVGLYGSLILLMVFLGVFASTKAIKINLSEAMKNE